MKNFLLVFAALFLLPGCATYRLVAPEPAAVGDGSLTVTPTRAWNAMPMYGAPEWEDGWTRNGPLLDSVQFITGMPEGKALVKQRRKADQQAMAFRADMTPTDLVSLIESTYRVRGVTVFTVESVAPEPFLGGTGLKLRYAYAPDDGISRKGSAVMRVIDAKLYLMKLDGVSSHYFDAVLPEFEELVASARQEN